jgi:integrase
VRKVLPKSPKPFPDFPLFWHSRGYWCVKRAGKQIAYTANWKESYEQFVKDEQARSRGEQSASPAKHTLGNAVNLFLTRQIDRFKSGEISDVQLAKYRFELAGVETDVDGSRERQPGKLELGMPLNTRLIDLIGDQAPMIFSRARAIAMDRGLSACERHIICVRAMLDYAHRTLRLPAPNYGDCFDKPKSAQLRKARHARALKFGERAWNNAELRKIVAAAAKLRSARLYAAILLALNVGYQAADVAVLPEGEIDHEHKLLKMPRAKNGMRRVSPLWDETYEALMRLIRSRPKAAKPEYAKLIFLLPNGQPCTRVVRKLDSKGNLNKVTRIDALNLAYKRLLEKLELERHGAGFNSLRAMFRTACTGASPDPDLVAVITGRAVSRPVDEFYLRGDMREKLFAVVKHVRDQIWPDGKIPIPKPKKSTRAKRGRVQPGRIKQTE